MIPRVLKFVYYVLITSAFCANILVVSQTTILSVLGASLALRGPDGSMMTATDGLFHERALVFRPFGYGLILTISSVVMCVWLHLHWEASVVCCTISLYTICKMRSTYHRIVKKFDFDESMTVDFNDIFDGPAAIHAMPLSVWRGMSGMAAGVSPASMGAQLFNNGAKDSFDYESAKRKESDRDVDENEDDSLARRNRRTHALEMV